MRRWSQSLGLATVALAAASCAAAPPVSTFTADDRAALESTTASALAIGNRIPQDWQAYVALYYAEDARVHMPGMPTATGRIEIADLLSQFSGIADMGFRHVRVDGFGDLAYIEGIASMSVPGPDGQRVREEYRYVEVWKRQADGSWKVIQDISNSQAPPSAPAPPS